MTNEESIKMLKYNSNVIHQTINGKADPKEVEALDMAIEALEQQKTGKWIDEANKIDAQFGRHTYKCSECGKYAEYFVSGTEVWWDRIKPNFCPNCGARMAESEEE